MVKIYTLVCALKLILQTFIDSPLPDEENFTKGLESLLQGDAEDMGFDPGVENPNGLHPIVLVCEHATARIPGDLNNLGLTQEERLSHIAWDPGALETAKEMSTILNAVLVFGGVSRLVYDCNRPPRAKSAMPERSEETVIPGNIGLSKAEREVRLQRYYQPFDALLTKALDAHAVQPVLVTIHSFTPVFRGQRRSVEIGVLHDRDRRLADALLTVASGYSIERNAPYGPEDGVTHTLCHHGLARGILNVMIEIRSDLIANPEKCRAMAETLVLWLKKALVIYAQSGIQEAAR